MPPSIKTFTKTLGGGTQAYLMDHRVQGMPLVPGTCYLSLACELANSEAILCFNNFQFKAPLIVDEQNAHALELTLSAKGSAEQNLQGKLKSSPNEELVYFETILKENAGSSKT